MARPRTRSTHRDRPLSLGAIHWIVHDRLGVSLSRPLLHRVYDTARGNPFLPWNSSARSPPKTRHHGKSCHSPNL